MALVDLVMPKMGESIMEATILKWLKKPGDSIKIDEPVLEIATDKVDSEVPSSVEGTLDSLLFNVNDVVPVGAVIARIRTSREAFDRPAPAPPQEPITIVATPPSAAMVRSTLPVSNPSTPNYQPASSTGRFYSPLVLTIASNEGIPMSELENIAGTGNEGRVTKKDMLNYLQQRGTGYRSGGYREQEPVVYYTPEAPKVVTPGRESGNVEIIEMDRMRKLIARHMVDSKHTSAHVTSFTEADVTHLVHWREQIKHDFEKREKLKITYTPLFIEAIVKCIKKFPWLNSSIQGDQIVIKKDIHIGMATALPSGNLIVPVIRNADQLNLVGLTRQVNLLAEAARNNRLKPEDTSGGTFTFTNVGTFGSLMGTPIINQPQVAILATGAIKKRPVVLETEQGDSIAIRHMLYISMSYDHRIIDGALGATFISAVAKELESFDTAREI